VSSTECVLLARTLIELTISAPSVCGLVVCIRTITMSVRDLSSKKKCNIADKLQPRNINISFKNNSNIAIDILVFIFYSD
jgi:hypothetical protein